MKANFFDYDIYHLGVSGGKDSTAALLWLIYESGLLVSRVRITFCDTGNEDELTYNYLALLSERVHSIQTIYPERDFWELAQWKGRFPSRRARFCTQWLKIMPFRDNVLEMQKEGANVLLLNGVRSAERHSSNNRGEIPQFGWDDHFACDVYHPVLDWLIGDVWNIHKRYLDIDDVLGLIATDPKLSEFNKNHLRRVMSAHGIPRNPLYDMNATRVGCFPCINSRKAEIRAMAQYRPERIKFIAEKEGNFRNGNMYSTMFARNTVPEQHRSKEIVTKSREVMKVATIHDVVLWSKTAYGGKQFEMDFLESTPLGCDIGGMCE